MSAYLVDKETIDKILTGLKETYTTGYSYTGQYLEQFAGGKLDNDEALTAIGQKMWDLNCQSVNDRYNEKGRAPRYKYAFAHTHRIATYKALQCLTYQSCEGDNDQTPLYLALTKVEHALAAEIIRNLPQYDACRWG